METLPESVRIRWSFLSSSSIECGIILRHYLGVGDLPIIVSHSFAALMLFVHLHTV
jgi:hypothetical protein